MSSSAISETQFRSTIRYINKELCEPKKSYIFVNGVENEIEDAEAGARRIASRLGDKRVVLFYNPTKLTDRSAEKICFLSQRLLELVHAEFRRCDQNPDAATPIKIRIFSHSHGSVLTKYAMQLVLENEAALKNSVEIVSLGGGTLISKSLAGKVDNIVNEFDLVPLLGNTQIPDGFNLNFFGLQLDGIIRLIFDEILLYAQNGESQRSSSAIRSSLLSRHLAKYGTTEDNSRFKAVWYAFISVVHDGEFPIKVVDSLHPRVEEMRQFFIKAVENPYSEEGVVSLFCIAFGQLAQQCKLPILEDHRLESYLSEIRPD